MVRLQFTLGALNIPRIHVAGTLMFNPFGANVTLTIGYLEMATGSSVSTWRTAHETGKLIVLNGTLQGSFRTSELDQPYPRTVVTYNVTGTIINKLDTYAGLAGDEMTFAGGTLTLSNGVSGNFGGSATGSAVTLRDMTLIALGTGTYRFGTSGAVTRIFDTVKWIIGSEPVSQISAGDIDLFLTKPGVPYQFPPFAGATPFKIFPLVPDCSIVFENLNLVSVSTRIEVTGTIPTSVTILQGKLRGTLLASSTTRQNFTVTGTIPTAYLQALGPVDVRGSIELIDPLSFFYIAGGAIGGWGLHVNGSGKITLGGGCIRSDMNISVAGPVGT